VAGAEPWHFWPNPLGVTVELDHPWMTHDYVAQGGWDGLMLIPANPTKHLSQETTGSLYSRRFTAKLGFPYTWSVANSSSIVYFNRTVTPTFIGAWLQEMVMPLFR